MFMSMLLAVEIATTGLMMNKSLWKHMIAVMGYLALGKSGPGTDARYYCWFLVYNSWLVCSTRQRCTGIFHTGEKWTCFWSERNSTIRGDRSGWSAAFCMCSASGILRSIICEQCMLRMCWCCSQVGTGTGGAKEQTWHLSNVYSCYTLMHPYSLEVPSFFTLGVSNYSVWKRGLWRSWKFIEY